MAGFIVPDKKPRWDDRGLFLILSILFLFDRLKTNFLDDFLIVFYFHKNIGAEAAGIGLQYSYTEMSAGRIAFVLQVKALYPVITKKVFYNKLGLGLAVAVALVR